MFGKIPLLNITRFDVRAFSFKDNDRFDAARDLNYRVTVSFGMQRPDGVDAADREFRVILELDWGGAENPESNPAYDVQITLVSYFETPAVLGDDRTKIPARILNNALMIAYGVARGIVGTATATNERGQFVLPAITFDALIEKSNAAFDDGNVSEAPSK
jgi:preprotein translocase subunit SecB